MELTRGNDVSKPAWIMGAVVWAAWGAQLAMAQPQGPGSIYTCVDRNGRRLTADRPIQDCLDREQRELGPTGVVRRQIGPSLTEQERTVVEAQRRKEAEERARVVEERRRERVLTARYPDKASHDVERNAAVQLVDDVTATAEKRIVDLRAQRQVYDVEMEFYKRDPSKAPLALRSRIAENEESLAEQQRFILGQAAEKRRVHQRFDVELAQLRRLWDAQRSPGSTSAEPGADGGAGRGSSGGSGGSAPSSGGTSSGQAVRDPS